MNFPEKSPIKNIWFYWLRCKKKLIKITDGNNCLQYLIEWYLTFINTVMLSRSQSKSKNMPNIIRKGSCLYFFLLYVRYIVYTYVYVHVNTTVIYSKRFQDRITTAAKDHYLSRVPWNMMDTISYAVLT